MIHTPSWFAEHLPFRSHRWLFLFYFCELNCTLSILTDDIFVCKNIDVKKGLAIIPYSDANKEKLQGYDFIFVWSDKDGHYWEKAFYTVDDPFGTLKKHAAQLYKHVQETELDAKVAPAVRGLIADYLKGGS